MKERIKDKIKGIEKYLQELEELIPDSFEDYLDDFVIRAACERYFEKIVESAVDLAFLLIRFNEFPSPESDVGAFEILAKNNTISFELSEKLKDAKSMRNIIAHEYGEVDDKLVFPSIKNELIKDIIDFLKEIKWK